ncbi:hypothetical protein CAPTEDRAFT_210979, partial [Capitella teleta]
MSSCDETERTEEIPPRSAASQIDEICAKLETKLRSAETAPCSTLLNGLSCRIKLEPGHRNSHIEVATNDFIRHYYNQADEDTTPMKSEEFEGAVEATDDPGDENQPLDLSSPKNNEYNWDIMGIPMPHDFTVRDCFFQVTEKEFVCK